MFVFDLKNSGKKLSGLKIDLISMNIEKISISISKNFRARDGCKAINIQNILYIIGGINNNI